MVVIIDYGMGNLASVKKALDFLRIDSTISRDITAIRNASAIILPGVGAFAQGMKNLKAFGLDEVLTDEVMDKGKKFLGICLGMQLIAQKGTEPAECEGLGWIPGSVNKMNADNLRIPHMGWNTIRAREGSIIGPCNNQDFYFIHSYHFLPDDRSVVTATANYGDDFVAALQYNNIFATQFHPEKSQQSGLGLLKSYLS